MKLRMVDRILGWEPGRRIRGTKTVSFEEYCLKDAFGEEPRLPESLILESLFQLGNWLVILSSDFKDLGIVIRVGKVLFESPLRPGESMTMEVEIRSRSGEGILFDGEGRAGPRRIASGSGCLAVPAPLEEYCDPGDLRVLFEEIHRPEERGEGGEGS